MYVLGGQPLTNKKAFTLIELLAVILILAIIALIATPIIMNIINDAKEEANKRSIELYGKAVEQAVARAQLTGEVPSGNYTQSKDGKKLTHTRDGVTTTINVDYSGNKVECTTNMLHEDGSIFLSGCTVGTHEVDYTYGKAQYAYLWYTGSDVIGPSIGDDASSLATSAPDANYYLKYKLDDDNKVTNSYSCAKFGGTEYCLEGGSGYRESDLTARLEMNEANYAENVKVLYDIQSANISGVSCSINPSDGASLCEDNSVDLVLFTQDDGYVNAYFNNPYTPCNISDGISSCYY